MTKMNIPMNIEHISIHKKKLEQAILKKTKKNSLFTQFCQCYLSALTERSVQHENTASLYEFLQDKFEKFITIVESPKDQLLSISQKSSTQIHISIICKDAQYLIFTLENVFKLFNLTITKMYHPLLSVYLNKHNKVILIDYPKKDSQLYSTCYIECQVEPNSSSISELEKELQYRLNATQCIQKDTEQMFKQLTIVQREVAKNPTPKQEFHTEWIELLDWLGNENFSFFGYAEFNIHATQTGTRVKLNENLRLGILSKDYIDYSNSTLLQTIKSKVKDMLNYRSPFNFDSIRYKSPIKRFENLMRIRIKIPKGDQKWTEYNFIGLLKRSSLLAKNIETPIIKLKIQKIFENKRYWPSSHNYNQTIRLLNNVPKIELFQTPTENLQNMVENLLSITNPNDITFFTRKKIDKTKLFLMGVIPNTLYSNQNLKKILNYLHASIPNQGSEYFVIPNEQFTRIHLYFDQPKHPKWYPNIQELETNIIALIKPWGARLRDQLFKEYGEKKADHLYKTYIHAFPEHHRVRRSPSHTLIDIQHFERIAKAKETQFHIMPFTLKDSLLSGKAFLLNIYHHKKIDLYQFIPIFRNLNLYFFDELTTRIGSVENMIGYIHSFRIKHVDSNTYTPSFDSFKKRLEDLLHAVFKKQLPNDPLNGLLSCSECTWKDIFILQAYRNYLLQLNPNYNKKRIDDTFIKHVKTTSLLVQYFKTKFLYTNSALATPEQIKSCSKIKKNILDSLNNVSNIDEDYILKWVFNLIQHTLRTNYYQHELNEQSLLSLKIDSSSIIAPLPKPFREIYVFSPDVEGIHIRFDTVSRGGIRWSSRISDYRNEILGLATTQRVKNVVIVPNGSKGGFVIKKEISAGRHEEESQLQYQTFINGLIDITDNRTIQNEIIKPIKTVCYDKDDPYLVVAADKGTSTFSDIANTLSQKKNFWLDDAFASGGSTGFSHKDLGITAKGGWECVKLHFLESGKNIDKEPFTCIGIGDMSGDVFGNGMLLSKQTKLVAAFNHIHIFIDPNPNPQKSWIERERLFKKPRSTWKDYSKKVLSKGGAIYDRNAKHIILSDEAKNMLGLEHNNLNGSELIKAILRCKTELLWFGGIGTYIKSENESQYNVGDLANDDVRINDCECNAKIIGEGANLGITQQARLWLSEHHVKLNTDFIDNSAGVNISDYEVNLKILLQQLLQKKHIKSITERNSLLKKSIPQVINSVLKNNIAQHQLLSIEAIRSSHEIPRYRALINHFIEQKFIDPQTDVLPSPETLDELDTKNEPLPRPLLALLQSLVKLEIFNTLNKSLDYESSLYTNVFTSYFPDFFMKKFHSHITQHPLRKEITTTAVSNYIINQAGILFFSSVHDITQAPYHQIAATYLALDELLEFPKKRSEIIKKHTNYSAQYLALIELENELRSIIIDALSLKSPQFNPLELQSFKPALASLKTIVNSSKEKFMFFIPFYALQDSLSNTKKISLLQSLKCIYRHFAFEELLSMLNSIDLHSNWDVEQYKILQKMLTQKKLSIVLYCIKTLANGSPITEDDIKQAFNQDLKDYTNALTHLLGVEEQSLSALTVMINKLNLIQTN